MYAILDTSVLVSGLRSSAGASHKVLRAILTGRIQLAISVAVAIEYEDVALRPGLIPSVPPAEIIKVIDGLCRLARHQQIFYAWRPFLPDADDDMVLELALAANSPFVITLNIKDFRGSESLGVRAITPAQALTMIWFMATMSIRVPESLHRAIKELATKDGYSMNQFLVTAAAEKLSALNTIDYLRQRAERADLKEFERILDSVPDVPPDPGDELP